MKLFNPDSANKFVIAALPSSAREGTAPTYVAVQAGGIEEAELSLITDKRSPMRPVYPYVLGRYDDKGRYMTYKPPIDGVTPGRFILHPFAQQEMAAAGWH